MGGLKAQVLSIAQGKRSGALGFWTLGEFPRPERAAVLKALIFNTFALSGRGDGWLITIPRAPLRLPWARETIGPSARPAIIPGLGTTIGPSARPV